MNAKTATKLEKAVVTCNKALDDFERSKRALAYAVYDAGYTELKAFCDAVKELCNNSRDRFCLSRRQWQFLFQEAKSRAEKSTRR